MEFPPNHPRGPNGGPMFLGEELCPICQCCSLSSEPCDSCGGDGYTEDEYDGFDSDDDVVTCDICDGEGGFLTCLGGCDFHKRERHKPIGQRTENRNADAEILSLESGKATNSARKTHD